MPSPEKISPGEQRRRVMRQAEAMVDPSHPTAYDYTIKTLIEELALLDGLYELMSREHFHLRDKLLEMETIITEDIPHRHLTARLYALVYPMHELEAML